jgi:ribosomal protein L29
MKASALREMTYLELAKKLSELEREVWGLRVKVSQQRNTGRIRELRRDVARVKMLMAAHRARGGQ